MNRDLVLLQACLKQIRNAAPSRVDASTHRLQKMFDFPIGHECDTDAGRLMRFWLCHDTKQLLETTAAIVNRQHS